MTIYYVSANGGSDSNSGTSSGSAFATLQKAAGLVRPGDSVEVGDGTYSASTNGGTALYLGTSGSSAAPITWEAAAGAHPIINVPAGAQTGIQVNANWVTVRGFEVVGDAQSVTLSYAQNNQNAVTQANGIVVGFTNSPNVYSHVTVENNVVHDMPGGGIAAIFSDYVTVRGNTVYGTSHWSKYGNSGISIYASQDSDTNTGIKTVVSGNVVHDNAQYIPTGGQGVITDGEGIIIDDNSNDQTNNRQYRGGTLVENNIAYNNGSSGLSAYSSSNVQFLYNTAHNNNTGGVYNAEMVLSHVANSAVENNIVSGTGDNGILIYSSTGPVTEDYNLGSNVTGLSGAHDISADPLFANAGSHDFSLTAGSAAIDKANMSFVASADFLGNPRPSGAGYDMGAYEYQQDGTTTQPPPPPPPPPPTSDVDTLVLTLSEDAYRGDAKFIAKVDGTQIAGTTSVTALHNRGQDQNFTFQHAWGAGTHTVEIDFINDAYGGRPTRDRNLYVDKVTYDGASYGATPAPLWSNGSFTAVVGHS